MIIRRMVTFSLLAAGAATAFSPSPTTTTIPFSLRLCSSTARWLAASSSSSPDIFLLSFDGTIAATTDYRINVGIDLAFLTWPHLQELTVIAVDRDNNHEWLFNKMKAISHVLIPRTNASLSCDYALLARLLMEEQELDGFRSLGSRGKYGSKFHPRSKQHESSTVESDSMRQTRPLTVGEVAINWNNGAHLGETLLTKYHVKYKNPLPVLQENLEQLLKDKKYEFPKVNEVAMNALRGENAFLFITVGHESDLELAKATLSCIQTPSLKPLQTRVVVVDDERLSGCESNDSSSAAIKILPVASTHIAVYEDILRRSPAGSTIHVFESSWNTLERAISLFGDNIPRGTGIAQTIVGQDKKLSLNFPSWSSLTPQNHPSSDDVESVGVASLGDQKQQNEALMNVWTNLVSEGEFFELLSSARMVGLS